MNYPDIRILFIEILSETWFLDHIGWNALNGWTWTAPETDSITTLLWRDDANQSETDNHRRFLACHRRVLFGRGPHSAIGGPIHSLRSSWPQSSETRE
jgi:hypothetical protein